MKGKIAKKLHSQRGVTILMALLFLLLCAMVGSVVVSSASANADKNSGRKQMQEQYLALSSAIRFIEDTIEGKKCVGIESIARYGCKNKNIMDSEHPDTPIWTQPMRITDTDSKFLEYLQSLTEGFFRYNTRFHEAPSKPSMPVSFTIEGEGMMPVEIALQMDNLYGLTFTLSVPGSAYQAILVFQAQVTEIESTEALSCVHNVLVTRPDSSTYIDSVTFTNKTYHYTTTVVWTEQSLTKGVVGA